MSPTLTFIADFRALHDKLRNGTMTAAERAKYMSTRSQFVHYASMSQQIGKAGETLRSDLRMPKMLKVEIRPPTGSAERTTTLDFASKGFASLMPKGVAVGDECGFTLFLPKPASPIAGRVRVASVRAQGGVAKVSFTFVGLMPNDVEQVDIALIDAMLERLKSF